MKKFIFILFCIAILSSCSIERVKYIHSFTEKLVFDFRKYTEKDFFITPEKYQGNYESIGIIDISIYPAAARQLEIIKPQNIIDGEYAQGYWLIRKLKPNEIINTIYEEANDMGANAIMNFKVTSIQKQVDYDLNLKGINVSGFAIKIQDK